MKKLSQHPFRIVSDNEIGQVNGGLSLIYNPFDPSLPISGVHGEDGELGPGIVPTEPEGEAGGEFSSPW